LALRDHRSLSSAMLINGGLTDQDCLSFIKRNNQKDKKEPLIQVYQGSVVYI